MKVETKGSKNLFVSGYAPGDVPADVLDYKSESVTPEIAAERAANRIILAVYGRDKNIKLTDNA